MNYVNQDDFVIDSKMIDPKAMEAIHGFLKCETPKKWIEEALKPENLTILLVDHLICELKAAQTAAWLLRKYALTLNSAKQVQSWLDPYENLVYRNQGSIADFSQPKSLKQLELREETPFNRALVDKMVRLIKEELHHFYQVLAILDEKQIKMHSIPAGRYAKELMRCVRTFEPCTFIDKLICGAYIEARSCERFAKLAPYLDEDLARFYRSLLRSEARHYQDYLLLAKALTDQDIQDQIERIGQKEAELILASDHEFRFHSGILS